MERTARPMIQPVFRALLGASALLCVAPATFGQAAPPAAAPAPSGDVLNRPKPSSDDLLKRLETIEDRNRELEQKVADLTRQQGEEWLGEQRAGQIREIVKDVLADSQTHASLQDSGMTAGWNDGFFMASSDGRFRLNIGGFAQTRFTWSNIRTGRYFGPPTPSPDQFVFDRKDDRYGFGLPNVQLWADGHVFSRDFQYMIKARFFQEVTTNLQKGSGGATAGDVDFSGFQLLDAWMRFNLDDNWSMRAGQFRSPFSRGFLVLEQYQMSSARSVVDYHYALGYSQGIELEYGNDDLRVRAALNNGEQDNLLGDPNDSTGGDLYKVYPTGSFGGLNNPWYEQNAALSVTSRVDWKPAGSWNQFRSYTSPAGDPFGALVGLGMHYQESRGYQTNQGTPGLQDPLSQWISVTLDGQLNFGGASLYGAVFYNYVNAPGAIVPLFGSSQPNVQQDFGDLNMFAFEVQGAIYLMPKVELFGRYEFAYMSGFDEATVAAGNPQLLDPDPMNLLTVGVNWYLDGQDVKWTTDLGWAITAVHPWFADLDAGWRPSRSDEIVFRTQLQLMF